MPVLTASVNGVTDYLKSKQTGGYPKTIQPYSGEISRLRELTLNTPAVLPHIPEGRGKALDTLGNIMNHDASIGIYCIAKNLKGEGSHVRDLLEVMDWVMDQLRGQTILINTRPIPIGTDFEFATNPDGFGEAGVAVGYIIIKLNGIFNS